MDSFLKPSIHFDTVNVERGKGDMYEDAKTLSIPEAGRRYFGLGRNASYEAAKRGEIPFIRIGGRLRSPIVVLDRMMEVPIRKELAEKEENHR
jgi:hypothetical protein